MSSDDCGSLIRGCEEHPSRTHPSTRARLWVGELFLLIMTHTGVDETLCSAANLRPEGGCRWICWSPLSASPGVKAVFCVPLWEHLSGQE